MRILILGASGFLGSILFEKLKSDNSVFGTSFKKANNNLIPIDIRNHRDVAYLINKIDPELIIDCCGKTQPDECEKSQEDSFQTNVIGPSIVLKYFQKKIIYFSSDYVFNGKRGSYSEMDQPDPINYYGWTKYEAEKQILGKNPQNLVIRVGGLYGDTAKNHNFLESMNAEIITRPIDCFSSNVLIDDIANMLPSLYLLNGIIHISDYESISRYDFSKKAVNILNLSKTVIPTLAKTYYSIAKRPNNCSLVSNRNIIKVSSNTMGLKKLKEQLTRV